MSEELFAPKERVPESGMYQVLHYRHRLSHHAILTAETLFPSCSECGENVRFRLVCAGAPISEDRNFRSALTHRAH